MGLMRVGLALCNTWLSELKKELSVVCIINCCFQKIQVKLRRKNTKLKIVFGSGEEKLEWNLGRGQMILQLYCNVLFL